MWSRTYRVRARNWLLSLAAVSYSAVLRVWDERKVCITPVTHISDRVYTRKMYVFIFVSFFIYFFKYTYVYINYTR